MKTQVPFAGCISPLSGTFNERARKLQKLNGADQSLGLSHVTFLLSFGHSEIALLCIRFQGASWMTIRRFEPCRRVGQNLDFMEKAWLDRDRRKANSADSKWHWFDRCFRIERLQYWNWCAQNVTKCIRRSNSRNPTLDRYHSLRPPSNC